MEQEKLKAVPIKQREAKAFIKKHHRHHLPPVGSIFQLAVARGAELVGVAIIGRPVSRMLDDGFTLEVTRLCTLDSPTSKHAASKLYALAWSIASQMGYTRLITYTMKDETGVSLVAAGWRTLYQTEGRSWSVPSRPRVDKHPLGQRTLWEAA